MEEQANAAIAADQLRVVVEMGDEYTPSRRVVAAIDELSAALQADEADEDEEVEGFGAFQYNRISFAFDSAGIGGFQDISATKWIDKSSGTL